MRAVLASRYHDDEPGSPWGGTVQAIATAPEFVWELSLGIYPIVKGFKASPILEAGVPTLRV